MSETTALVLGKMFGKHNFSYFISPKKTWEGFAGQFIGIIVSLILIKTMMFIFGINDLGFSSLSIVLTGLAIVPVAILGDLVESILKRAVFVKDSSENNHLGSLGGVLDKFDSFGVSWMFFSIIVKYIRPEYYPL